MKASSATLAALLLALAHIPASAQELSPMEAVEGQHRAILEADQLDDVVHLLPESWRAYVASMSDEEKTAGLADLKDDLRNVRLIREWVDGNDGVVMVEAGGAAGLRHMVLEGETWSEAGRTQLMTGIAEARGGFSVAGAVDYELEEGIVSQTQIGGAPVLTVTDPLARVRGQNSPTVQLALPSCIEPGSHPLEPQEGENVTVRTSFRDPPGEQDADYGASVIGRLEVDAAENGRFSGTFQFDAGSEGGGVATVEGWLENAQIHCDGDIG